jgi:ribonuclease VapC
LRWIAGAAQQRARTAALMCNRLLAPARVEIVAVDFAQANAEREAFRQFGKARHPVGLNFGDCFAYDLAKFRAESLLFKGSDFSQTDVLP